MANRQAAERTNGTRISRAASSTGAATARPARNGSVRGVVSTASDQHAPAPSDHAIARVDRELLPDDIRVDRELATAAIDEHRERYVRRAAEVGQLVECGAHGAPRVQHVVDDHHSLPVEIPGKIGGADDGTRADGLQIVAIERDVEGAARDGDVLALLNRADDAVRELHSAALDADDDQIGGAVVQLDDLFGHAAQRPVNRACIEQGRIVSCHRPAIWRRRDPD